MPCCMFLGAPKVRRKVAKIVVARITATHGGGGGNVLRYFSKLAVTSTMHLDSLSTRVGLPIILIPID